MITISELSNDIFQNRNHRLSSPFGKRAVISTSAGYTSGFHKGADYATCGEKLLQYAVSDGTVISCGKDVTEAKFVWVEYPALKVKMLHYHLDSILVKKGDRVKKGTALGRTGKTGKATGVHLHLGIKRLNGGDFIDPEKWSAEEYGSEGGYTKGTYIVEAELLNVREGAGTTYRKKSFSELTSDAQKKIKKLCGTEKNGYVKGLSFSVSEVNGSWGRTPSGWVCLDYCRRSA